MPHYAEKAIDRVMLGRFEVRVSIHAGRGDRRRWGDLEACLIIRGDPGYTLRFIIIKRQSGFLQRKK